MTEWQNVKTDGLPPNWTATVAKPPEMGWLIYDGKRVGFTTVHPAWWNHNDDRGPEFDGPKVTHWADAEPPSQISEQEKDQ